MLKIYQFIKSICTICGVLMIISGIGSGIFYWYNNRVSHISEHTMLMIDFSHNYGEAQTDNLLNELMERQTLPLQHLIEAIEMAAADKRIDGIVARLDVSDLEPAQIQDVARAISIFRKSGKQTIVFSQGFGPFGQGNREYYLASFFDKIYMQPHTTIGLTGISLELPFARETLNKIGVYPEFYTRYEHKTAMMNFTDTNMPALYKADMERLGNSLMQEFKQGIVKNRALTEDIDVIINKAPLSAEEGLKLNLIDEILYLPQLDKKLRDTGIKGFMNIENYAEHISPNKGNLPVVAVLNLNGIIDSGENSTDIDGEFTVGSRDILADISEIADMENLKAVVVRINSPGGSYNAADEIYFALKDLKAQKNIPIIVSQSGYAASGGYFISLAGDKIYAEPTTITGSIGVLGGKFVLQKLWQKIGVNWADIKIGQNAGILSMNQPFSAKERQIFNKSLDEVYRDFTTKVVENRPLTENIDKIARGRVWSGRDALALGLVDALGNLEDAVLHAKQEGGIEDGQKYTIVTFPREKNFSEKLRELLLSGNVQIYDGLKKSGVDIRYLKLFKRLQYDTVLLPFELNI
ncbi:MAG: signal peptide peptidase SppA [Alphaproteobacteria bacterium]|nr:signal peptide peptidase SppA [Alphaproteobacteria bacterium]